jgi:hypothetical protein
MRTSSAEVDTGIVALRPDDRPAAAIGAAGTEDTAAGWGQRMQLPVRHGGCDDDGTLTPGAVSIIES